jgi:hypothetical protein
MAPIALRINQLIPCCQLFSHQSEFSLFHSKLVNAYQGKDSFGVAGLRFVLNSVVQSLDRHGGVMVASYHGPHAIEVFDVLICWGGHICGSVCICLFVLWFCLWKRPQCWRMRWEGMAINGAVRRQKQAHAYRLRLAKVR